MEDIKLFAFYYINEKNIKIPGLTDFISFNQIPVFVNFNIFEINVITGILNGFKRYFLYLMIHKNII